jgi:hypothetical protein
LPREYRRQLGHHAVQHHPAFAKGHQGVRQR